MTRLEARGTDIQRQQESWYHAEAQKPFVSVMAQEKGQGSAQAAACQSQTVVARREHLHELSMRVAGVGGRAGEQSHTARFKP